MRQCAAPGCTGDLAGKRSNAVYCDRTCKVRASDARRIEDGRSVERDRARYEKEGDHRRAYASQYLADNPERMRAIRRNRKSKIKATRLQFTEKDWTRLVARFRGCCAYCGKKSAILHREHVIPIARGGRHSIGNILPACPGCNLSKKTRYITEWKMNRRVKVAA